jgi:hypothetical protein
MVLNNEKVKTEKALDIGRAVFLITLNKTIPKS